MSATLEIPKHIDYIQRLGKSTDDLAYHLTSHLRLNAVYWGFTAVSVMGQPAALERDSMIEFVLSCWDEGEGAFGTFPDHDAHILPTLSAIQILVMHDTLDKLDKDRVTKYVLSLQAPDGSFAGDRWGEFDTRFTYCAISALSLLGELSKLDVEKTLEHIRKCKNFDGGFGSSEGAESHAAQVFVCLGTLAILDRLEEADQPTLAWWLAERQLPNGGLNGRPEKLEDDQDAGGIADRPGDMADVFHTLFGVAGLSLLGYPGLVDLDPVYCMPAEVIEKRGLRKDWRALPRRAAEAN
ncbi:hypothetical protein FRC06_005821 [Ceratobasidium sp. 370]|nr:hypothetical protein FRC06_005821 [Ceratobasidium sp. 370]